MKKAPAAIPSGVRGSNNDGDLNASSTAAGELKALMSMIKISADTLICLRTECATTAGLIQQEIRTLEGKLIKLFSRVMVLWKQLGSELEEGNQNALDLWLSVVGLSDVVCQAMCSRIRTLEDLMSRSDSEVRVCLKELGASAEDTRRLVGANKNLRRYTDILMHGGAEKGEDEMPLHWDSWDRSSPSSASSSSSSSLVSAGTEKGNAAGGGNRHSGAHRHHHARKPAAPPSSSSAAAANADYNRASPTPPSMRGYDEASTSSGTTQDHGHSPQSPPVFSPSSSSSSHLPAVSVSLSPTPSPTYPPGWHSSSPPPSPPVPSKSRHNEKGRAGATPPPRKTSKHQGTKCVSSSVAPTCIITNANSDGKLDLFPLTKSKSHESQLGSKIDVSPGSGPHLTTNCAGGDSNGRRSRLPTDGGIDALDASNVSFTPPLKSPPPGGDSDSSGGGGSLQAPRSPNTPTFLYMGHVIEHRFTKSFSFRVATCDYCQKQMIIGMRCKECKYKCHNDCMPKVPPSCGLPPDFIEQFQKNISGSPILGRAGVSPVHGSTNLLSSPAAAGTALRRKKNSGSGHHSNISSINTFQGLDSSSTASSCNSSTPSSPNVMLTVSTPPSASRQKQFFFPDSGLSSRKPNAEDVSNSVSMVRMDEISRSHITLSSETSSLASSCASTAIVGQCMVGSVTTTTTTTTTSRMEVPDVVETQKSSDSERTLSVSGTNGSGGSVEGSTTDSERTVAIRLDSQDSQASEAGSDDKTWPRQNSLSLKEWDIPFNELQMMERIGVGRFGSVFKGQWHGYVAIKVLNMDNVDDRDQTLLEAFKNEVGTFRKTRHENLVLFMGACMKPPHLAIVTSLCKGNSLYTHIHIMKDRFSMSKTVIIAQQISQGMGYLHARGIVHKDLKTRNIFLEGGKVVITDFGLFSVAKLCSTSRNREDKHRYRDTLVIPKGWLCYLSPEIMRNLRAGSLSTSDSSVKDPFALPFSKESDLYAFGTVWYELLCGEFPFEGQPAEAVIWQVGKGIKDPLVNLQPSREVKEVLMSCWAYKPEERPEFGALLTTLENWPKKRPARSPSYPTHLSRSHESVF